MAPPLPIQGPGLAGSFLTLRGTRNAATATLRTSASDHRGAAMLEQRLGALRGALEGLRRHRVTGPGVPSTSRDARAAEARSRGGLELPPDPTATTLRSSAEINTTPTSFTPQQPSVSGTSTTQPTLGGAYDGSQGDDTLTFEFRQNRTVGSPDRLNLRVYDGSGTQIDFLRFSGLAPGTPVALENGLTLALGPGDATRFDTFTVDVSATLGTQVNPNAAFDGTYDAAPGFEAGHQVVAGSFDLNGVRIDVAADDSIDSVLAKIDASAAGVDAAFDPVSDAVVLTQRTLGPGGTITLENDSSGFLAATKLAGAVASPGEDAHRPAADPIAAVAALAGITAGNFSIGETQIDVDPERDSLDDVIQRINASSAGVIARLDPETLVLSLSRKDPRAELVLGDGTSGFFSGVKITPATYQAVDAVVRPRRIFHDVSGVRRDVFELRRALDALLTASFGGVSQGDVARQELRAAISAAFQPQAGAEETAERNIFRSGFGIDFDFTGKEDFLQFDAARFEGANESDFEAMHDFLFGGAESGETGSGGLVDQLIEGVETLQQQGSAPASLGRIVDLFA